VSVSLRLRVLVAVGSPTSSNFPKPSGSVSDGKTIALYRFSDWHI
jgi:hypothetical protein